MSLAERLQQLIGSHESRIKDYEGRIEKMEKDINKNRNVYKGGGRSGTQSWLSDPNSV